MKSVVKNGRIVGWMKTVRVVVLAVVAWGCVGALMMGVRSARGDEPAKGDGASGTSIYDSLRLDEPTKPETLRPGGQSKQVVATGKRYALLVGVEQATMDGVRQLPLPQCLFDATTMRATLEARGYTCEVFTDKTERKPVTTEILPALRAMCNKAEAGDIVMVYFSTHGLLKSKKSWVALMDEGLEIAAVKRELSWSKALVKVLVLDCCRGDAKFMPQVDEVRDIHTIMACRPDELSSTGPNGLSVFTEVFCDALTDCRADRVKDGRVELDELMYYLDVEVPKRCRAYKIDKVQNPTRSVVDPKSVNPIVAMCGKNGLELLSLRINQPTASAGVTPSVARNDLVLSSLLVGDVKPGTSIADVEKRFGEIAPELLDKDKSGAVKYPSTPKEGDELVIVFEKGVVNKAVVQFATLCKGSFDAAYSRKKVREVLGGKAVLELGAMLSGMSVKQVQEKIGCASGAILSADGFGDGTLKYEGVPLEGQTLTVEIKDGKAGAVDILIPQN